MRNLKKILALVLAFLMSLSLMATAGAADFPDSDGISNDAYALAADILSDLNVFVGDQNGNFNPDQNITRAEVAAIIYRISTGDVTNEKNNTYTSYGQFGDVINGDWYEGYVTYCAIAGYVKGRSDGNFWPKDPVTGYEVLAMILRAVGYDKGGEFVGSDWQINTARIARENGILDNITNDTSVQLGEYVTREVVAEILFQAIQVPQVTWSIVSNTYTKDGPTLAKEHLGMESVTGVVMANEWANINDDDARVLADGKTELKPDGESALTLDIGTELDAVGQTYTAYIQNGTRVLGSGLARSSSNAVAFNEGKSVNVASLDADETHANAANDQGYATIAALAAQEGITLSSSTLYYLNYDLHYSDWETTDIVIRYAVAKDTVDGKSAWLRYKNDVAAEEYAGHTVGERTIRVNWDVNDSGSVDADDTLDCWVFTISPEYQTSSGSWVDTRINGMDLEIMQAIFYNADRLGTNNTENNNYNTQNYVYGEVYVGTTSMTDESDTLSWKEFQDKYFINHDTNAYSGCGNGNSLRVIDNDGDGVAEYVFKVTYHQDKAITSYNDTLEFYELVPASNTVWNAENGAESFEVSDVVNYRTIDGKTTVWKAEVITDTIKDKSFKDITVTPADHEPYGQSDIANETPMSDDIMNMLDQTEYNMYLDQFGYIRTYELAQGSQYALVTEIYPTNQQAHNYVTTNDWRAEVKAGDADIDEYVVSNASGNPFITSYAWTSRVTRYSSTNDLNYLQPAIAHLGMILSNTALTSQFMGATSGTAPVFTDTGWNRGVFALASAATAKVTGQPGLTGNPATDYGVFDYGPENDQLHSASFTNVAAYTMGDGTVSLSTAAQLAVDRNGNQIYRVGSIAVQGSVAAGTPNKQLVPGVSGTEQELKDMWVQDNTDATTGEVAAGTVYATGPNPNATVIATAANNWWNNNYSGSNTTVVAKDGTMIYPVYAVDYVHLAAQDVSPALRHYAVYTDNTGGSYSIKFNTNSNNYVNAVVDTEFYVVMPNRVVYCESYADLPTIAAENVRAMYAVATNTTANAADVDFWTANVIVIETTGLVSDYDSISLMYYNPWENTASVRYVDSLNNQWRTYGAVDPDMTVVPASVTGASAAWGNQSWSGSNYGFYKLYSTEYTADSDELTAGSATIITSDWNANHIYAGTIRRLSSQIANSNYIDVDLLGRDPATLSTDDAAVVPVGIRYNDGEVPIYRVNSRSVSTLRLAPNSTSNEVLVGDEIIWVTDNAGNVAYIIDLGSRSSYTAPTWLIAWTSSVLSGGYYKSIVDEQTTNMTVNTVVRQNIDLSVNLGAYQTITISGADLLSGAVTLTNNTAASTVETARLTLNGRSAGARLQVSVQDTRTNAYMPVSIAGVVGAGNWTMPAGGLVLNTDGRTYTLQLNNTTALPGRTAGGFIGLVIYTQARIDELVADANKTVGTNITAEQMQAVYNELTDIAAWTTGTPANMNVVTVPGDVTPGTGMAPATDADTTDKFNSNVIDDAITDTGDQYVSVDAVDENVAGGTHFTVTPTAVAKASIAGQVFTVKADTGYALSGIPTVKINDVTVDAVTGGTTTQWTWDASKGTITFDDGYSTTPAGDITITMTTTSTTTPAADVSVSVAGTGHNLEIVNTDSIKEGASLADQKVTLNVASAAAANGYTRPTGVGMTVSVGGTNLSSAYWSYNATTGEITFASNCPVVAGAIVVTATAVAPESVAVELSGGGAEAELKSPTSFKFNEALAGKTIVLALAENVTDKTISLTSVSVANSVVAPANYDFTNNTITFNSSYEGKATGPVVVTVSVVAEPTTLTVTGTGIESVAAKNIAKGVALDTLDDVSITAASNYTLTGATVSVTMGGTALTVSTDYSWTAATGTIAFTNSSKTVSGPIAITVTAVREQVNVTLSGAGAGDLEVAPTKIDKGSDLAGEELTISQSSGGSSTAPADGDASKVTVSIGGTPVATGADTWSYADGKITFASSYTGTASGDITITIAQ